MKKNYELIDGKKIVIRKVAYIINDENEYILPDGKYLTNNNMLIVVEDNVVLYKKKKDSSIIIILDGEGDGVYEKK